MCFTQLLTVFVLIQPRCSTNKQIITRRPEGASDTTPMPLWKQTRVKISSACARQLVLIVETEANFIFIGLQTRN